MEPREHSLTLCGQSQFVVYCKIHVSVLWGNVFVKQSSEFDKQEGFSSEKCVFDYKNTVYSGLTK